MLPMLNKRKSPRRKMVLPVKVSIDKATHLAHTLDITPRGARLGALRTQLKPGTIITLQRGTKKAEFRVEWIKQLGPNELQAGIESLEPQNSFFGASICLAKAQRIRKRRSRHSCLSCPVAQNLCRDPLAFVLTKGTGDEPTSYSRQPKSIGQAEILDLSAKGRAIICFDFFLRRDLPRISTSKITTDNGL